MSSVWRALALFWFYLALVVVFALGWYVPGIGTALSQAGITPYLVAFAFFLNGFTLSTESMAESARHWYIALPAVVLIFIVSPALALLMRAVIPGGHAAVGVGFQLAAGVPTMLVSAVIITRMAGGNGAAALYLTVLANMLAIVVVPPLMQLTLHLQGKHLAGTALSLAITVLLPTVLGQLARYRWSAWASAHARQIGVVSQLVILLFIITGLAELPRERLSPLLLLGLTALCLTHHVLLLLAGHTTGALMRVDVPTRRALAFCASQKSIAFMTLLWRQIPVMGIAVLPGIIYYVTELAFDSLLAQWWGRGRVDGAEDITT